MSTEIESRWMPMWIWVVLFLFATPLWLMLVTVRHFRGVLTLAALCTLAIGGGMVVMAAFG
ncbi:MULTISPECIES: hypothetical protein [Rhodomicrobium]|uniref:hypothetical protein n=1 Tax=Rhodomicrobium TaxID=1068 RepID=UPI000F735369|nr:MULTISPECIES: hypothetical protein [Rhodomicrobium]